MATVSRPGASAWSAPLEHLVDQAGTDLSAGLSSGDAAERLQRSGRNELDVAPPPPMWARVLRQFADPLVGLLLVAIAISLVAWALEGAEGAPFDAIVVAVIVLANAAIGLWQEAKAAAAVAALARLAAPAAKVLRDGAEQTIPTAEVVPGDVLLVAEGDAVCADGRVLEVAALRVDEAALTGESVPTTKQTEPLAEETVIGDRTNMVFSSTAVTSGHGRVLVTGTGMGTEIGHIAALLDEAPVTPSPLQREIAHLGRTLGTAVVIIALVVVAAIFVTSDIDTASDAVDVLLVGVSLAVAAVPEGLPAILAVVLALGVQRMATRRAVVKKLASVESLGSASVICSDKTGTLTRSEMTIERVVTASGAVQITGVGYVPEGQVLLDGQPLDDGPLREEVALVIGGGSLANNASLAEEDGAWAIRGDPTEAAFLVAEAKLGGAPARLERFERIGEAPFTSDRKLMSTIERDGDVDPLLVTKGAPDVLLDRCTSERAAGRVVPLTPERRAMIKADIDGLADDAMRTLAVGCRRLDSGTTDDPDALEYDLTLLGTVGIIDPARPEAATAIDDAHRAGVRVIMITGDHPRTAGRIAERLRIESDVERVVSGIELDRLDDAEFAATVRSRNVFARVSPEHKLRIVRVLQADGEVVAMTGDGVNDAPALKAADIGVAMGIAGTEVSKEAADMILADDNFATIVTAVREGRRIFSSIQEFLRYLLSSNMGEILTMLIGVLAASSLGLDDTGEVIAAPLLATHILWINLLTDTAPALALGIDPPVDDVMARRPRRLTDRVVDAEMRWSVLLSGLVMALATLAALDLTLAGGLLGGDGPIDEARTMAFTTLVLAQLFNCLNSRSARASAFRAPFSNRLLWLAIALSLLLQVLVVYLPILNDAFETVGLSLSQWLVCTGLASTVLVVDEIKKFVLRRRHG